MANDGRKKLCQRSKTLTTVKTTSIKKTNQNTSSFYFKEEHQLFRKSLKYFLAKEVIPNINQWEKDGEIPREIYLKFGEMGYLGLELPEKYGGMEYNAAIKK
ncbi:MAG: acyl-CoA dehydrogenase family protein [Chitinophagales bacterium]